MIFPAAAVLIGLAILAGGLYYFTKTKEDPESRRIYLIVSLAGAVLAAAGAAGLLLSL